MQEADLTPLPDRVLHQSTRPQPFCLMTVIMRLVSTIRKNQEIFMGASQIRQLPY